ncbi:MAG: rhodanese-like domain-containing protein [Pseudomonadota bacterium]
MQNTQLLPSQSQPLFKTGSQKRLSTHYIAPQNAFELYTQKKALLIDIRHNKAFQHQNIPGSLNIPPHFLKTKNFLKNKHLILLNQGHSYRELENLYLALGKAGFNKVSVLEGGLNQWPGNQHKLNRITPAQFYKERHYQHWLVVNISSIPNKQLASSVVNLPISDNNFTQKITQAIAAIKKTYILIISTQEKDYLKAQALLRNTNNIYYLQGGIHAYQDYLKQVAAINY